MSQKTPRVVSTISSLTCTGVVILQYNGGVLHPRDAGREKYDRFDWPPKGTHGHPKHNITEANATSLIHCTSLWTRIEVTTCR